MTDDAATVRVTYTLKRETVDCLNLIAHLNQSSQAETITSLIWSYYDTYYSMFALDDPVIVEGNDENLKM